MRHAAQWIVDGLAIPQEYLRTGLLVSLLSVWILVILFFYLNRYTKRRYFAIWNVAWLFYAVWLSLGLNYHHADNTPLLAMLRQWCLNCSAAFLLWGSASFLGRVANERLIALFTGFLFTWSYVEFFCVEDRFWGAMPVFALMGVASVIASVGFLNLRRKSEFVGAGLLSLGFLLWGVYLVGYPLISNSPELLVAAFFLSAALQLLIAVSMIVLVLEEARRFGQKALAEVKTATVENSRLATRVTQAEERYRTLFEQAHDGIILVNAGDLRMLDWNPAAQRLLGMDPNNSAPLFMTDFLTLPDIGEDAAWFDRISQSPRATLRRRDGKPVAVDISSSEIKLMGQPTYHIVMRELTERVRLEQKLREAERLSAMGQMAAGIAHEVNNPLAIMSGYLELILARPGCDPEAREDIQKVIRESNRAAGLIKNFMLLTGGSNPNFKSFDLNQMVSEVVENQQLATAEQNVRWTVQLDLHCPPISGDAKQLARVLVHLLQNAWQATEHGSLSPRLKVVTRRKGELVQIVVEDNGPGVPPHLVSKIFEPFFTTRDVGAGTGIGLSVSHQIIADHHGRIFYDTSELGGAAFTVELPLVSIHETETHAEPAPLPEKPAAAPVSGARILMIDDEAALAEMVCEFLIMSGHQARFCSSSEEALTILENSDFDLVISDFRMPGLTGEQLFERTVSRKPELAGRIIFMTGDTSAPDVKRFLATHNVPCLSKPCALPTIEQFVNTRLALSGPVAVAAVK